MHEDTLSLRWGAIVMISGVVAFADPDPYQAPMRPAIYRRGIGATLKSPAISGEQREQ